MGLRTNPTDVLAIAPARRLPCIDSRTSADLAVDPDAVEGPSAMGMAKYGTKERRFRMADRE